jgi:chromosome segregation ATPase
MGRVTVHIADSMLSALDAEAHNRSISRSQAVAEAVDFFISGNKQVVLEAHKELSEAHNKLSVSEDEVMRLNQELSKLNNQIAEKDKILESNNGEIMRLQEEVKRVVKLQEEAEHNRDNYEELKRKYDQLVYENTSRWEETKALKNDNTKLTKSLNETQSTTQKLKDELIKKQTEVDQIAKLREELIAATIARDKLQEALKVRDDDIAYFKSHVAQLTQSISQLSLKPGEEEIKKKGWWQFWK